MKTGTERFLIAVLFLGAQSCAAPTASPATQTSCAAPVEAIDAALAAKIDPLVDSAVARGFAGGVAVMKDGVVIYDRTAGSASLEENIPVTEETLFHVASITKYFTAALTMKAVEEGKFSLNDSVAVLAPETKMAERGVTFFDLLAHRSGLGASYVAENANDNDAALEALDNAPYDPDKAGHFRYSNDGYDLLGVLLERAYGRPYEDLLKEKIFAPACLRRASHWALVDVADPHVVSQPLRTVSERLRRRNYGMMGSAGLLITARDLAIYEAALTDGKILSDASLKEMIAPRGETRIGQATFGAFLSERPGTGPILNARGYEDWGDNAIMNHYLDSDIIVAVVTSRGPTEDSGAPPFRNELSEAIEKILIEESATAQ